jgi:hypothetical protein
VGGLHHRLLCDLIAILWNVLFEVIPDESQSPEIGSAGRIS